VGAGHVAGAVRVRCLLAALAFACAALGAQAADPQVRSADGRWILRADNAERVLLAIDAHTGVTARRIPIADRAGVPSGVARLVDAAPRCSFIGLLADVAEAWELSYDPAAEPVYGGLVHDFRMGEALAEPGPLPVRRIHLDTPLADVLFTPRFDYFVGRAAAGALHVVSLAVRRRIETLVLDGDIAVARGVAWQRDGRVRLALPGRGSPVIHVLDGATWRWLSPRSLPAEAVQLRIEATDVLVAELVDGRSVRMPLDPL
jgi:hypothetical protein